MQEPQTKGLQFRSFARVLKELRGDAALAHTLELLPQELADGLRFGTLVTGGWYPLAWYAMVQAAAQRATGEGPELARTIGRTSVQHDFRGVYRLITLALSPQAIFGWAPKVIALYYDTGRLTVEVAEKGYVRGNFKGMTGFDRNLWEDLIGGSLGVLELAGAKNLTPRVVSGGKDGDADMIAEMKWT